MKTQKIKSGRNSRIQRDYKYRYYKLIGWLIGGGIVWIGIEVYKAISK